MTDPGLQFSILLSLSGTGIAVGGVLAALDFADKCLGGRRFLLFLSEFTVTIAGGALIWLVVLFMNDGVFRLFFVLPTAFFAVFCYICILKLLSPRIEKAKSALKRFKRTRAGSFLVKYILK